MSLDQLLSRGSPRAKEVSLVIPETGRSLLASLTSSARKRNQKSLLSGLLSGAGEASSASTGTAEKATALGIGEGLNGGDNRPLASLLGETRRPVFSANGAVSHAGNGSGVVSAAAPVLGVAVSATAPGLAVPAATPPSHRRVSEGSGTKSSRTNSVATLPDSQFPEAALWEQSLRSSLWRREPRAQSVETLRSMSESTERRSSVTLAAGIKLPASIALSEHHGSDAEGNRKARARNRAISRTVQAAQIALRNAGVAGAEV